MDGGDERNRGGEEEFREKKRCERSAEEKMDRGGMGEDRGK